MIHRHGHNVRRVPRDGHVASTKKDFDAAPKFDAMPQDSQADLSWFFDDDEIADNASV